MAHKGAGSRNVIELHGNITRTRCFDEGTVIARWANTGDVPPPCPNCDGLLRPDVVWFEEPMPETELNLALRATANCDVFLSIGTSTIAHPAASLPFEALRGGATVVEINPELTPRTAQAHHVLRGAAGIIVPRFTRQFQLSRG